MSKSGSVRKCLGRPFMVVNEWVWFRLPSRIINTRFMGRYGGLLHGLVKARSPKRHYHGTYFFRNRPELDLIRIIAGQRPVGSKLIISVLGCSNGAEVYSLMWTVRSARPDLMVIVHALDISSDVVKMGKEGVYPSPTNSVSGSSIFDRITEKEMQGMFDREDEMVRIKGWLREGINWLVADAGDPALASLLNGQDIVIANRFLCHMSQCDAERCLRNIAGLPRTGGYLFVSGVDLDIRTKVAFDLGLFPVQSLIEEMHDGDVSVRRDWPWKYWGLEPFDRRRKDWRIRYASAFQVGSGSLDGGQVIETAMIPLLEPAGSQGSACVLGR